MMTVWALAAAIAIDLALGDPATRWHPVSVIGRWISRLERILRDRGADGFWGGVALVGVTVVVCGVPVVWAAGAVGHPAAEFCVHTIIIYFSIALGSLLREGRLAHWAFDRGETETARAVVGRICGRDAAALSEAQLTAAVVESLAENSVDAFTAPVFFAAVFGPAGAWIYRIVNTLDSMVGYKTDRYILFGRAAARLDDVLNWIPARLTAMLIALWAPVARGTISDAWKSAREYAPLHASPNAGWTESAVAGALRVRLGGPANYFGERVEKPFMGPGPGVPHPADIKRAEWLVLAAAATFTCVLVAVLIAAQS